MTPQGPPERVPGAGRLLVTAGEHLPAAAFPGSAPVRRSFRFRPSAPLLGRAGISPDEVTNA